MPLEHLPLDLRPTRVDLQLPAIDLSSFDERTRLLLSALLNIVQQQQATILQLQQDNQALRDEVARLKKQPPRPKFPPPKDPAKTPLSSENERKTKKSRQSSERRVLNPREQICPLDPSALPTDAIFKGYEDKLVQDILLRPDNICFRREKYYSPSLKKTFLAPVPPGYEGDFGPNLRAWLPVWYFETNTSQPRLLALLHSLGIDISAGEIDKLVGSFPVGVAEELAAARCAAIDLCPWMHLDDTGTCIDGVAAVCFVMTNPLGTFYDTRMNKDRQTVIRVLRGEDQGFYRLNSQVIEWMTEEEMPPTVVAALAPHASETTWTEAEFVDRLGEWAGALGQQTRRQIRDLSALADYHSQERIPTVLLTVADDAPQYRGLTQELSLCWIHRGRNVKKLQALVPVFAEEQQAVLGQFWSFYRQMTTWQKHPAPEEVARLKMQFEAFTSQSVVWEELQQQLSGMVEQKEALLETPLRHPEVPLHNNPAELGARVRVRKRDVSFGPRSWQGAKRWDFAQSLFGTLKTLGVRAYEFLYDRLVGKQELRPLAELMAEKAEAMHLGWTWGLRPAPGG